MIGKTSKDPFDEYSLERTPILTQLKKEKHYKTMDALYRDMKAIAGEHSTVILYEIPEGQQLKHIDERIGALTASLHVVDDNDDVDGNEQTA